jgi:hypothetical protein
MHGWKKGCKSTRRMTSPHLLQCCLLRQLVLPYPLIWSLIGGLLVQQWFRACLSSLSTAPPDVALEPGDLALYEVWRCTAHPLPCTPYELFLCQTCQCISSRTAEARVKIRTTKISMRIGMVV